MIPPLGDMKWFYRRSVKGPLQTSEFLVNGRLGKPRSPPLSCCSRGGFLPEMSARALQMLNLPGNAGIPRKFSLQPAQQFHSSRLVLFAHVGDRQEDPRKRRQIVPMLGSLL